MKRKIAWKEGFRGFFNLFLSIFSIVYLFSHRDSTSGILFATTTFGSLSAPSDIAVFLDSVFATSLPNYSKQLIDNVGASNAFMYKIMKNGQYKSADGGTDIREPLLYALATMDSYDGYDELSTLPTDGITSSVWEWRQLAVPIAYAMKEVIQNKHQIVDFVEAKIMQAEEGIKEGFSQQLNWGSGDGALQTPKVSIVNGSSGIEPIAKLIAFDPTASLAVGNINQSTSTWWRNKFKSDTSGTAAGSFDGFLRQVTNVYNSASLGTGGPVDLMVTDQITYELLEFALYNRYRQVNSNLEFPFENIKYKNAVVVMDDKIPDVSGNLISAATKGTIFFINTKYFKLRYEEGRDFQMLKDEGGKTMAKPLNQDARVGHVAWMGNTTVCNRRKNGVLGNIDRTKAV